MMPPLVDGGMSQATGLAVALVLGIAFGWWLERGGLGHAPKLAAQFSGTDWTVMRVMFTAIVTAMLGVFWLGRLGVLDVARVYVPPTYIVPQLVGGLIFGAGFAVAGLCPGTACVSAATGRLDGVAVIAGMLAGVFAFHELFAAPHGFTERTAIGALTLPDLVHTQAGTIVLAVVVFALIACTVAARVERSRRVVLES
jgi:hypothetical protein